MDAPGNLLTSEALSRDLLESFWLEKLEEGRGWLDKCIDGATSSVYCTSMATTQAAVSVDDPYALRPDCTDSAPPRFRIKVG